jgi:hypothetical protein
MFPPFQRSPSRNMTGQALLEGGTNYFAPAINYYDSMLITKNIALGPRKTFNNNSFPAFAV